MVRDARRRARLGNRPNRATRGRNTTRKRRSGDASPWKKKVRQHRNRPVRRVTHARASASTFRTSIYNVGSGRHRRERVRRRHLVPRDPGRWPRLVLQGACPIGARHRFLGRDGRRRDRRAAKPRRPSETGPSRPRTRYRCILSSRISLPRLVPEPVSVHTSEANARLTSLRRS